MRDDDQHPPQAVLQGDGGEWQRAAVFVVLVIVLVYVAGPWISAGGAAVGAGVAAYRAINRR